MATRARQRRAATICTTFCDVIESLQATAAGTVLTGSWVAAFRASIHQTGGLVLTQHVWGAESFRQTEFQILQPVEFNRTSAVHKIQTDDDVRTAAAQVM